MPSLIKVGPNSTFVQTYVPAIASPGAQNSKRFEARPDKRDIKFPISISLIPKGSHGSHSSDRIPD